MDLGKKKKLQSINHFFLNWKINKATVYRVLCFNLCSAAVSYV